MLVLAHDNGLAFLLRQCDRRDFGVKVAAFLRGDGLDLAAQGHLVLVVAVDLVVGGDILRGFRHGIHAIAFFHQLVDEAPANGGVVQCVGAAEGTVRLGHHKGGAAHAFSPAGNHERGFAGLDGARGRAQGIQAGAAEAVDGGARYFQGHAGE